MKDQNKVKDELDTKATKEELADLEARMMQRLQDMFDQLRTMFPDKEAMKKKLGAIEKNVRLVSLTGINGRYSFLVLYLMIILF